MTTHTSDRSFPIPKKEVKFPTTDALEGAHYLDYVIASLDLETLDLAPTCVVHELGIVFTNILPRAGRLWNSKDIPTLQLAEDVTGPLFRTSAIKISVIEQMLNGRTVTQDTLDFHRREMAKRGLDAKEYFFDQAKEAVSVEVARGMLEHLVSFYSPKEIWCNHTSFDMPRISGALFDNKANALPWHYRKEYDIHTEKRNYRRRLNALTTKLKSDPLLFEGQASDIHDSISDCLYNLSALSVCQFDVIERKEP